MNDNNVFFLAILLNEEIIVMLFILICTSKGKGNKRGGDTRQSLSHSVQLFLCSGHKRSLGERRLSLRSRHKLKPPVGMSTLELKISISCSEL